MKIIKKGDDIIIQFDENLFSKVGTFRKGYLGDLNTIVIDSDNVLCSDLLRQIANILEGEE